MTRLTFQTANETMATAAAHTALAITISTLVALPCILLFFLLLSGPANAGIFSHWFNGSPSGEEKISDPCQDIEFRNNYGRYCTGLLKKEIRCLSDGRNPGVCDSAAVCNVGDNTAKKLCETHCLNTSPQKLGNQFIQVSCKPRNQIQSPRKVTTDRDNERVQREYQWKDTQNGELEFAHYEQYLRGHYWTSPD